MTPEQESHFKAMASKMQSYAESIVARMKSIQEHDLSNSVSVETISSIFKDMQYNVQAIRQVYDDMMPKLPQA